MKSNIFRLCLIPATVLLSCWWTMAAAAEDPVSVVSASRVATVTPIAHSLSAGLLRGTGVETDFLPPRRLPINRIESWLRKNRATRFASYEALVSISDAVPAFAFSTTLRQSNIRLVTIDIAYARLPEGERVVLNDPGEFFWLNSNNLLLMLGVLKRDLALLWPEHGQDINENYQRISGAVRRFNLDLENLLLDKEIAVLVFDRAALKPLAGNLSTDIMTADEAQLLELPALHVGSGRRRKQSDSDIESQAALLRWQIDDLSRFDEQAVELRLQSNLQLLRQLFE